MTYTWKCHAQCDRLLLNKYVKLYIGKNTFL